MLTLESSRKSPGLRWPSWPARNGVEQLCWREIQRGGESDDHVERRTVFSALEHAEISLTQTGGFGETLLRQAPFETMATHHGPEKLVFTSSFFAARHPCILTVPDLHYL